MSERFLKFIPSDEAMWLLKSRGHAFRLLTIIAESARRYEDSPDGLKVGEAFIGGHENYDMTEQNYRTAKKLLEERGHIQIIETCRTRKKSEKGNTTISTKVKLISRNVYDINSDGVTTGFYQQISLMQKSNDRSNDRFSLLEIDKTNDRSNDRPTTDQRPTNDKQEVLRSNVVVVQKEEEQVEENLEKIFVKSKINNGKSISANVVDLVKELRAEGFKEIEIIDAIEILKKSDKIINTNIKNYLTGIIKNTRENSWKTQKKKSIKKEENLNPTYAKDKGFYSENGTSESPLAIYARQIGLS